MVIHKYKNGNFTVRRESGFDTFDLLVDLCNSTELDFTIAGDPGCLGNSAMFTPLYNYNTGLQYSVTSMDERKYAAGKTVRLCGFKEAM